MPARKALPPPDVSSRSWRPNRKLSRPPCPRAAAVPHRQGGPAGRGDQPERGHRRLSRPAAAGAGRGLDLTIRPGERIVLTGPSGAGKSSLLALLLRFIQPTAGTIRVGDGDLAAIPVDHWRDQVAWVPQQPYLFAGSAADNIALGQPGASAEAIARAARAAGAAEFIEALPGGYRRSRWESAAYGCQQASGRSSRWLARSCETCRCCSWTSRPLTWIRLACARSGKPSRPCRPTAP